ncbi:MAG TPA: patatin-like phospholipase family protein [Thermoleophilaceae bacterium]|nr:patatin-like phospholipase family protein [Thermoleophilaceae bacterium]
MTAQGDQGQVLDDLVVSKPTALEATRAPQAGTGLCLSGGGYRAMLFHAGALRRLSEAALLARVARVSSVSGGSIAAAALAVAWPQLKDSSFAPTTFEELVEAPLRRLAERTIDVPSVLLGLITPFFSASDYIARSYRPLLGEATLQDLPDDPPRFVFTATNLQSTVLWRFSKPYAWDYLVGKVERPELPLTRVVAASSASPPFLSPVRLKLRDKDFAPDAPGELGEAPYTTRPVLSDGGVYDNLGLEPVWKRYETLLVSDGGGKTLPSPDVAGDWARHSFRVLMTIDNQVRSLRKRALLASYEDGRRRGAYWGIRTDVANYARDDLLPCPLDKTRLLAAVPTRLKRLAPRTQEALINWGYAVCDAAIRTHLEPSLSAPGDFPYPAVGVG